MFPLKVLYTELNWFLFIMYFDSYVFIQWMSHKIFFLLPSASLTDLLSRMCCSSWAYKDHFIFLHNHVFLQPINPCVVITLSVHQSKSIFPHSVFIEWIKGTILQTNMGLSRHNQIINTSVKLPFFEQKWKNTSLKKFTLI